MRSMSSKPNFMNELNETYKRDFESRFAIKLSQDRSSFISTNKVSSAFSMLIRANREKILALLSTEKNIISELKAPFFGALFRSDEQISAEHALDAMLSVLDSAAPDLNQLFQIHCVFMQKIHNKIITHPEKDSFANALFNNHLFAAVNRKRIERNPGKTAETHELGIVTHPVYRKKLSQFHTPQKHIRAIDRFFPDASSSFFKSAAEINMPTVCGASGHTGSLMLAAKLYGAFTPEELQEYIILAFAFLAAGGNHSFHEVMVVAARLGVIYEEGKYFPSMPESIKTSDAFMALQNEFPQYLEAEAEQAHAPTPL